MTPEDASKFIAYVLRHAPESIGLRLDAEGWADIDALVAGAVAIGRDLTRPDVVRAVDSGTKKRYELSADGQRIRALQGHSTPQVRRSFEAVVPPARALSRHGDALSRSDPRAGPVAGRAPACAPVRRRGHRRAGGAAPWQGACAVGRRGPHACAGPCVSSRGERRLADASRAAGIRSLSG
jgi:hypothetical protein